MAKINVADKWNRTKRWLRRRFPLPLPARILLVSCGHDDAGTAEQRDGPPRFVINIGPSAPWQQREVLLHEWAHCLTWGCGDSDEHGPIWSAAHGLIYREYLAWNYGNETPESE